MSVLQPVGMDTATGQFKIAQPGDTFNVLAGVSNTGSYSSLSGVPTNVSSFTNDADYITSATAPVTSVNGQTGSVSLSIPAAQVNSDWNASSGVAQILNKPSIPAAQVNSDWNAVSGVAQILNKPTIPSTTRTTSALTLSLVGSGATGTQISSTKDSTVRCSVSTSTTSTIGGPSTSVVVLKICATNNATEGSWTSVATFESDQTITLAVVLQSIQIVKGQLCTDVPAGWFVKLVNSGTGTHSESWISGQQTIYG